MHGRRLNPAIITIPVMKMRRNAVLFVRIRQRDVYKMQRINRMLFRPASKAPGMRLYVKSMSKMLMVHVLEVINAVIINVSLDIQNQIQMEV